MENALEDFNSNPNHPCHGKKCKDCEYCIFDIDIKPTKEMNQVLTCDYCDGLIKNYLGNDRSRYNACCNKCMIMFNGSNESRPRIISANVGAMVMLPRPNWCPKARGVNKEYISSDRLIQDVNFHEARQSGLLAPISTVKDVGKPLTYTEKKDKLMQMPKKVEWDDIQEDGVYVIPKILYTPRKVIRVVSKSENFLRYSEIDEYGQEGKVLTSLYPKDIEAVFITKVLKY